MKSLEQMRTERERINIERLFWFYDTVCLGQVARPTECRLRGSDYCPATCDYSKRGDTVKLLGNPPKEVVENYKRFLKEL